MCYSDFEKLAHVIGHGLQGFIVENTEGEWMEAKRSRPYFVEVELLCK